MLGKKEKETPISSIPCWKGKGLSRRKRVDPDSTTQVGRFYSTFAPRKGEALFLALLKRKRIAEEEESKELRPHLHFTARSTRKKRRIGSAA